VNYPAQRIDLSDPPPRLSDDQLARRMTEAFPESAGPGIEHESGAVTYGQPGHPRVGPVPHLLDPATRDRENRERYARWLALSDAERTALLTMRPDELRKWTG
jgi:hypothetical protein